MTDRGDDAIELLAAKLHSHPALTFSQGREDDRRFVLIEAPNPGGFSIRLKDDLDEWTVYLGNGGFHAHFEAAQEALEFIAARLSADTRLIEVWRGSQWQSGKLQFLRAGRWWFAYSTGTLLRPFWRRKTRIVRQNRYLSSEGA